MNRTRTSFLEAAEVAVELLRRPEVAERWSEPGASEGMTVGAVAAHLVSSGIAMVVPLLEVEGPAGTRVLQPSRYYSGQSLDLDHEGHHDVRQRAQAGSRRGAAAWATDAAAAVAGLTLRLPEEPDGRRVLVLGAYDMTLDGFLVTRLVELLAHTDDLAASAGLPTPDMPPGAVTLVVACLTDVARRRHGDIAVLRTLARRERSPEGVFPVF
jgi:hypothetical protein